jgi:NADH:ubiquinone oxidoreductase subunit E
MQIAPDVEESFDMTGQEKLTPEIVEEIAADVGASESHVFAAAAMMTDIPFDESDATRFEVCVGGCQQWGALPVLEKLVQLRAQRQEAGEPSFGVVPRRCLDKCDRAAVVLVKTPDGTAGLSEATPETVGEAVAQASA